MTSAIIVTLIIIFIDSSIFRKDASHGLSYEKMVYNVDKTHPRVTIKNPASKLPTLLSYSYKNDFLLKSINSK